jgi:hypothetical protein
MTTIVKGAIEYYNYPPDFDHEKSNPSPYKVALDGWHVMTTEALDIDEMYINNDESTYQHVGSFFGVTTYYYVFKDESQARELMPQAFFDE